MKCVSGFLFYSFVFLTVSGCWSDDSYYLEFRDIKIDQFQWGYGSGGIYWVSDNKIVTDAVVKNKNGLQERGIYEVDVLTGNLIKISDVGFKNDFSYCFDGKTLFLTSDSVYFGVDRSLFDYEVVERKKDKLVKGYKYSEIRCLGYKVERGYRSYALKKNDGFILAENDSEISSKDIIYQNNSTLILKPDGDYISIDLNSGYVFNPKYIVDRDMYFGYQRRSRCVYFWWLKREGWKGETEDKCYGAWAQSGNLSFIPTRKGMFIEHHAYEGFKTYLSTKDKLYPLEKVAAKGGALAPDGCRIAYGSGDYRARNSEKDFRQILKVFNACEFLDKQ